MLKYMPLAALALFPTMAAAQTATAQFNVQLTIAGECQINSAQNMNFGNAGVLGTNVDATSNIEVLCTANSPFTLGLDEGQGLNATAASRLMTAPGGATVNYALYRDAARSLVWGETVGSDTLAGTGTGTAQSFTVYGRVPPQAAPEPATYTDVVTVTMTY